MKTKIFFIILLSVLCLYNIKAQKHGKRVTIKGCVLDSTQRPIADAFIMIDNVQTNSMTNAKGNYRIKVKQDATVIGVISFGHGIMEEAIAGRTQIDFNFKSGASQALPDQSITPPHGEAINTGYNKVRKENLTSPISKIDGTETKYASYLSVYDIIREIPEIQIYGTMIVIQGSQNLAGFVPALIIVDGVYVDNIDYIRPASVKSIEVLKGASASIYGSRGYGGVILITTKNANNK